AVDERQFLDGLLLDDEADRAGFGLELLDAASADLNGLGGSANLQGDVLLVCLVNVHEDVGALLGLESLGGYGQGVRAGVEELEDEVTGLVRGGGLADAGRLVRELDSRAGKKGSSVVGHFACNAAAVRLRQRSGMSAP